MCILYRNRSFVFSLLIVFFVGLAMVVDDPEFRRDETIHGKKIIEIILEKETEVGNLANIPGYHYALASVARTIDAVIDFEEYPKKRFLRGLSITIFGFGFVFALYAVVRSLNRTSETLTAILLIPIIFPYIFLLYTDIPATMLFLGALWAHLRRRDNVAGLLLSLGVLIRQDLIIWLMAFGVLSVWRIVSESWPITRDTFDSLFWNVVRRNALYAVGVLGFMAFYIINGGVAVGDKGAHPAMHISAGNIYFFFIMVVITMLPIVISRLPHVWSLLKKRWRWIVPAVVSGYWYYASTCIIEHDYNFLGGFLHNMIVMGLHNNAILFFLGYCATVLAMLALGTLPMIKQEGWYLMFISIVALSLHWMIEPRYALIPIILLPLFFDIPKKVLRAQIVYGGILTLPILWYAIFRATIFL